MTATELTVHRFTIPVATGRAEHRQSFPCFGGRCTVIVADRDRPDGAAAAAAMARRALLAWHERFTRFTADSELARLNRDPRPRVPVTPLMRRMVEAALAAAHATDGLVDFTLGGEIERAGYASPFDGDGIPLQAALTVAPPRSPARPHPGQRWRLVSADAATGTIGRPPGLRLDFGGIAKGVFADELAAMLAGFDAYAIDCAGDVRVGGRARMPRPVHVESPFPEAPHPLTAFGIAAGAVATSGTGRRSWLGAGGRPAHHLLDPATGAPVFSGVVQATALAPTAAEAEMRAKAALLSGPARAAQWLTHGGAVVLEDGSCERYETPLSAGRRAATQAQTSSSTASRSGSLRISWRRPS